MKLVINSCYGGFGLSPKALKRYLELKSKQAYFYKQTKYSWQGNGIEFHRIDNIDDLDELFIDCTTEYQGEVLNDFPDNTIFPREDIPRNDKHLVQVVEELGAEANSKYSKLEVVEIENGRWYKIDEYDGYESIEYRDLDDEWELAEDNDE